MNASESPRTALRQNSGESNLSGWPVEQGHEQNLWQSLEYVNDTIYRVQVLYEYAEELERENTKVATEEAARIRQRLASTGRTIENQITAEPDYANLDNEVIDAVTEFYSELRTINSVLENAWSAMNDVVGSIETVETGWCQVSSNDSVSKSIFEARNEMWEVQARIEQLLIEQFNTVESAFDRPSEDLNW